MPKVITITPITELGPVLAQVPFHRTAYIAEAVLNDRIIFSPLLAGSGETFEPLVGGTAVYKLTGDGASIPTFSNQFLLDPRSTPYNELEGQLNIITFTFDGTNFWYKIASEPKSQPLELIGDFGYGPGVIVITGIPTSTMLITGAREGQITAFDILTSIHYLGSNPLTYAIQRSGDETWVTGTDPRLTAYPFDNRYVGVNNMIVYVTDGDLISAPITVECKVDELPIP